MVAKKLQQQMTAQSSRMRYQLFPVPPLTNLLNNYKRCNRVEPSKTPKLAVSINYMFILEIMDIPLFNKFKFPNTGTYDGTKKSLEHLKIFKDLMDLYAYSDTVRYPTF